MSTRTASVARAIAMKDLRIERRSRVVSTRVLPFSGLVMLMFAFVVDDDGVAQRVAPGLVWLATLFAVFFVVQRAIDVEIDDRALDTLRAAGVDMSGVFLGKSLATLVHLLALEGTLVVGALVLYGVTLDPGGVFVLLATMGSASAGFALVGTLYAGLTAGASGRGSLLPLLALPVFAPVLLSATRATEAAFGIGGARGVEGWPWVGILVVVAGVFGVAGVLAYPSVLED